MVFGTFDILHPGHIHMLKQAKKLSDSLVVVIARDETVVKVKHKPPRNKEEVRLQNIKNLGLADKVLLGDLKDKLKAIREEKPDIIALGYDQQIPVDNLAKEVGEGVKLVRLESYKPELYKSSKLTKEILSE